MTYETRLYALPNGRQALITTWPDGGQELAFRDHPGATWGPPYVLDRTEEVA